MRLVRSAKKQRFFTELFRDPVELLDLTPGYYTDGWFYLNLFIFMLILLLCYVFVHYMYKKSSIKTSLLVKNNKK